MLLATESSFAIVLHSEDMGDDESDDDFVHLSMANISNVTVDQRYVALRVEPPYPPSFVCHAEQDLGQVANPPPHFPKH